MNRRRFWALAVGGVAPASAAGCAIQVGGPSFAAAEICYLTGAGIWVDTRTSSAADANPTSVWSPPYTGQNDGTAWEAASGGDEYIRTDECVEVTPEHIRLRKVALDMNDRVKLARQANRVEN